MIGAVSLLGGVLLGLGAAAPVDECWMRIAAPLAAVACCSAWSRFSRVSALLLAGMVLSSVPGHRWESLRLPVMGVDQRGLFEGRVVTVPERDGGSRVFEVEGGFVAGIRHDSRPRRIRIEWPEFPHQPRVGERWRLLVRLRSLEPTRNFAGLDTARLALRDDIHATGRVLRSPLNTPLEMAGPSVHRVRARVAATISGTIADPDAAALVTALAVGLTGGMGADQWRVFNATGTTHLVAISGLHVTLFAWLSFRLARFLWRWLPWRGLEREPFAWCLGLAAAGGYAWLAGFSIPTQRTWLMLSVFVAAGLASRHAGAGRLWSMALVLVLLHDPLAPLSAGFWLSFVAVGVLMLAGDPSRQRKTPGRWAWMAIKLQLAVMLALAPAGLAIFGTMSIVGLAVNLIAIPVVSFMFVPVILAGVLGSWLTPEIGEAWFSAAAVLHEWLWPALVWCADLPGAAWRVHPTITWYLLALPATLIGLLRWPWPLRITAASAAASLIFALPEVPQEGEARVVVTDAGRGTAVWIATRTHHLVYDTGDAWGTRGSRMRRVVMPLLDSGGARVDMLVLPTLDADRASAAALLAFERGIGRIVVGGGWPGGRLRAGRCKASRWTWDGVTFDTFTAGAGGRFCLLRIATAKASLLLTGDIDAASERALLARLGAEALASDAVLVSRQVGSAASSAEWIEAMSPGLAIASGGLAGSRSREAVLHRWRSAGAAVIDTREEGAVDLSLGLRGLVVEATANHSRYPFVWRRSLRYSPRHVGNSESRRPLHVADHPVFRPAGRNRARAALDPAAQAGVAAGAHQEGDPAR